jgi:DNA-binding transcriptional regulator LsrR (DeoR family)
MIGDLEPRLKSLYPVLRDVIIVPTVDDYTVQLKVWGQAAAQYFQNIVKPGRRVGLSGGITLFEMVMAIQPEMRKNVHFYAMAIFGRSGESAAHIDPTTLVMLLWERSGQTTGNSHFVTVSPHDSGTRQGIQAGLAALEKKHFIKRYMEELRQIDIAFLSIGLIDFEGDVDSKYRFTMTRLLEPYRVTPKALIREGAQGDVNYSVYDLEGRTKRKWKFFLGLDVDFFARMAADSAKTVVVIAGTNKERPLRAALKRGLFNVWITDLETAKNLSKAD